MEDLVLNIEALIFASEQGIGVEEIQQLIQAISAEKIELSAILAAVNEITEKYENLTLAINLVSINGGFQFLTKKTFHPVIAQLQIQRSKKKLSRSALETLAIIAYQQPITKLEIEQIRGVNCDYTVQKLLDKELIVIVGRTETIGKPILYGTSNLFSDYFGINSIADLPQLKDLKEEVNHIGNYQE
jgi:segregation and condensation protein B